jgi:hypothetical protein
MNRWGNAGPPDEAYSRVTQPERFAPLHALALNRADELAARFEVAVQEGFGIDPELESVGVARPTVSLTPANPAEAPLTIAFTSFPGLRVRLGRWLTDAFPVCGCDACDESFEGEAERFTWRVDQLINGRFREWIHVKFGGRFYSAHEFWSPESRSAGETLIHEVTPEIRASRSVARAWAAWTPRGAS